MLTQLSFVLRILQLHLDFDLSVTSWFRTPHRNALVGGHPQSKHLMGLAVDVVLDPEEDQERFCRAVRALDLAYLIESDHIHIQVPKGASTERVI